VGEDCCEHGNACRAGLVCQEGTCDKAEPSCGAAGQACCTGRSPCQDLLSCSDGTCVQGITVSDLEVVLRTNDEDKDDATGVKVAIDGLASWRQTQDTHYDEWSTHTWPLIPSTVGLSSLAGRYVSLCMQPSGNDTWKLNFLLQGKRSDGLKYEMRRENVFLSTDVPCLSWDATPDPVPRGQIGVLGKCLNVANGGANVGTPVALTSCVEGIGEDFVLAPTVSTPAPDGARQGEIRHAAGKCLGLARGSTADGTPIQLQSCDGSPGQRWK
jgi:hypothetical protein